MNPQHFVGRRSGNRGTIMDVVNGVSQFRVKDVYTNQPL